jgi:3-phenylpropionate/cinnamic acid dioxygenase small subunit
VASEPDLLAERQAVVDVCTTYAFALDGRDWTLLRTCFTEDAVARYGDSPPSDGYAAIEATCRRMLEPLRASQHLLGNHLVTFAGEEATSACYFQAQHVRDDVPGGDTLIVAGRYDDRFVHDEDRWRIAERTLTVMWTSGNLAILGLG